MKRKLPIILAILLSLSLLTIGAFAAEEDVEATEQAAGMTEADLVDGVNTIIVGANNTVYNIGEGQVVMISGQNAAETDPIVFDNCTFSLSGGTVSISGGQDGISYNNGETVTKLWIGGNVEFRNCTFVTEEGATKTTSAGYDAAIYFFSGNINLYDCTLTAEGYNGQFLGLYGSAGAVTFNHCDISTVGNKNGWSYAMYAGSVLKLVNGSSMTATGMTTSSGNINAFYSGDNKTGYNAIFVEDSTINFSDNQAGGFAINNVNIYVTNSTIKVNDNLGNACNSGYWIVNNSTIQMNGNRGGHALSCIGFEMTDSTLEVLHNGYAGVYIQSRDSSLTNCTVDIRCNGEKLLSYTAGDVWLNGHTLTINGTATSVAYEGAAWLGAVGRKGAVITCDGSSVVAYDLNSNADDNLKSNTEPVLGEATIALSGEENGHTLLLNPFMGSDYARGNAEKTASNNDADLFKDDNASNVADILGTDKAKIGTLTDAQLSHHKYDWTAGEVKYEATETTYGAWAYPCVDVCENYTSHTGEHLYSFDCAGTYVYAPLVGLAFDANAGDDYVTGMPDNQTSIAYGGIGTAPTEVPVRYDNSDEWSWVFTGWYTDAECTIPFDFTTALTDNWTVAYAGWERIDVSEGALAISKTVVNGDQNREFAFTVTLTDAQGNDITGSYRYVGSKTGTISSGDTITLTSGQTVAIINLPVNTVYTVTEEAVDYYVTTITGHDATDPYEGTTNTGTIVSGAAATVHYTNTYDPTATPEPEDPTPPVKPVTPVEPQEPEGLNTEDHIAYIIGYPDGGVHPQGNITRAEVATIFFRLLTDETRTEYWSKVNSYSDVSIDEWFNNAISTLSNMGIIDGYEDGTFRPNAPITRAEFTKIAVSFFQYADYEYQNTFSDVSEGKWYTQFIAAAVKIGLIEGYPDGTFRPDNYITRAEACTIVNRTLGRAPDDDHLLPVSVMITWPDNLPGTWYYADMQEATNSHDYNWLGSIEDWTAKLEERDWDALENAWSEANDAPGGEVMG